MGNKADVMNLQARSEGFAEGTVLEARVDKGQGVVVTGLVSKGTLQCGDCVLAGPSWGRIRRILSDENKELKFAGPSTPVQVNVQHLDMCLMKSLLFFCYFAT